MATVKISQLPPAPLPLVGADLVPIVRSGTTSKTTLDAVREYATTSVKNFGAVGNGIADDTVAVQAAINSVSAAGGGTVYFPQGTYLLSSELTVNTAGVSLVGANRWSTILKQNTLSAKILNISASFTNVSSLGFIYNGTPINGATAIYCIGAYCTFQDFIIRSSYIGLHYKTGVAGKITNFEILDYELIGILVEDLNDIFISSFILNAGNATRGALGGIRLLNKTEAVICTDGDILLGVYSMTTAATSFALGARPAYNNFTNVFFDSGSLYVLLDRIVETEFIGCWFSNGRTGTGEAGCLVNETNSINFIGCRFFNCGGDGCAVTSFAVNTTFIGCSFESNSVTAGNGVAHGLNIFPNTNSFTIANCKASNGLFSGRQGYGIIVQSGTSNKYSICNNLLDGNFTGSFSDGGLGLTKTISGNVGYKTLSVGTGNIPPGATSAVITHGMAVTPQAGEILIAALTPNGSNPFYIDFPLITSTTFTVKVASPAASDFYFSWRVAIQGN